RENTKQNIEKTQNKISRKHKTKYRENTKRNTAKTQNKNLRKHKTVLSYGERQIGRYNMEH
ncbi:MAG: hypothetical protein J6X55_13720, partial [Victivallales bacterium]|nr:hypothetical protein [Victivallales bacterium]